MNDPGHRDSIQAATAGVPPRGAEQGGAEQGGGPAPLPYFYRFKVGEADVTVASDGPLELGDPGSSFLGVTPDEVAAMLRRHFLRTDNVVLEQNSPIVTLGGKTVIFDTGMGTSKMFGPTTGRLMHSLREAGVRPADIDAVVCSHAHIDHIGGICDDAGRPNFPNAEVFISERDFIDWTDESRLGSSFGGQILHARKNLLPVRDRLVFYRDGQEFLPGIQALASPGHTLGHHCFIITSAGKSFCFVGDLTHHHVLLFEKPLMQFAYDADPALSARSRVRVLQMLAAERIPLMSYHFPWPGLGHAARDGEGFRYFAEPMHLLPA